MTRPPLRILYDCDGPLADFVGALCERLSGCGYARAPASVTSWDLAKSFDAREMSTAHEIMSEPGFVSGIGWVDGAADAVRLFRRWGHDVLCVTSPYSGSRTWMRERLEWLEPLFHHDDVLFVKGARKPLVRGDVLVEDHPAIACAWLEANPEGKAILVDRPWNSPDAAEWQPHDRMIRVLDAADIPTIVHLARRL